MDKIKALMEKKAHDWRMSTKLNNYKLGDPPLSVNASIGGVQSIPHVHIPNQPPQETSWRTANVPQPAILPTPTPIAPPVPIPAPVIEPQTPLLAKSSSDKLSDLMVKKANDYSNANTIPTVRSALGSIGFGILLSKLSK